MSIDANQIVQRAVMAHQSGKLGEAEKLYKQALATDPNHFEGLHFLGLAIAHRNPAEGEKLVRRSLEINRSKPEAFKNHALVLNSLRRHQEAIDACDSALALAPGMTDALVVRCNALRGLERFEEALTGIDRALAAQPNHAVAHAARGDILAALGRHDESIDASSRALALNPNYLQAACNRGLRLLAKGRFEQGWPGYERRFEIPDGPPRPLLSGFAWTGQPLNGKSILVHEEQGLGDAIQFARYLPLLRDQQGAHATFVVRQTLWRILRPLLGDIELASSVPERPFDYHCMMMSLPAAFKTSVATIPASPSYLAAEPELVERWRGAIGTDGFKVGICWQGDAADALNDERAIPLEHFAPLAEIPGVRLISLQTRHGLDQAATLPRPEALTLLVDDFGTGADAFVDLAAAMKCVDLVVTPDAASAHLGGALGVPTWVALNYVPDWRWMLERTDSPWYPSVRLFRQPRRGDWQTALDAIAGEIRTMVASR